MRVLDSAIMARLAAKTLRPFLILDMEIDGTHYRYTDCDVPLVVGGYTYAPRGAKLEPVRYSIGTVVDSMKIEIDNLDDMLTTAFVGGTPQGSDVTLQMVLVEAWGEVDDETGASWGPTVHGLSLADAQAFIAVSGVDLSPYAGTEGSNTPYMITLHDSAGKTARGLIGAADAAEALGSELVTNGDNEAAATTFDEDGNGAASSAQSDEEAHAGTYSTKVTLNGTAHYGYRYFNDTDLSKVTAGKLYKMSCWVYLPSGQAIDKIYLQTYGVAGSFQTTPGMTTTDMWVQITTYLTVETRLSLMILAIDTQAVNNTDYFYIDDISIKEVTDVGATGVHIVSAQNGSTRDWASIETGFDYNGSAYTFEVRDTSSATNRAYFNLNDPVTIFQGTIDGWNLDEEKVNMTVASELVRWNQRTLAKHSASCRWKAFKGTECAYAGAETWCDRTYTRCAALGNQANFGGFRWLPSIMDKEIWWGRSRSV